MQIGVQELHIARVIKDGDNRVYGEPIKAAKSIKIDLATEIIEASLYSHDELIYHETDFKKGKITLNLADLPQAIAEMLLDLDVDEDGVLYAGNESEENPPVWAVGFQAAKDGGKNRYVWLLEVTFSTPDEHYETKSDGINIITPTITGDFVRRPDGRWKADYVGYHTDVIASGWFDEVRQFVSTSTAFNIDLSSVAGLVVTGVWDSAAGQLSC